MRQILEDVRPYNSATLVHSTNLSGFALKPGIRLQNRPGMNGLDRYG